MHVCTYNVLGTYGPYHIYRIYVLTDVLSCCLPFCKRPMGGVFLRRCVELKIVKPLKRCLNSPAFCFVPLLFVYLFLNTGTLLMERLYKKCKYKKKNKSFTKVAHLHKENEYSSYFRQQVSVVFSSEVQFKRNACLLYTCTLK